MEFSIKMEAVASLITAILFLFHYERKNRSLRYHLYTLCLISAEATILLDIAASLGLNAAEGVPLWIDMLLNTAYFLAQHITFSVMAGYSFYLLFEYAPDKHCLYIAVRIIALFCAVLLALIAVNPWTGWFFYFKDGAYMRGPLNKIGYGVLAAELGMLCTCYVRNRRVVSRSMRRLMKIMPPVLLLLGLTQMWVPDTLLAGTISALANMIFFISFQSNRIGLDALTELPDRHRFFRELQTRSQKKHRFHAVLLYLEDFDLINRKYGTAAGDNLLYMTARYLDSLAPAYQAFRMGSTRFLLLGSAGGKTEETAREVKERFEQPWEVLGQQAVMKASVAHMTFELWIREEQGDDGSRKINHILEQLEYTLSCARDSGGGPLCFDRRLREMYERREYVLGCVRKALEEESFQVYYQPIYSCREREFRTAESLLRLFDEQGMPIPPGEFIPLAEKTGLIDDISWLVLKKVCCFLAKHPDLPLKNVSINMSIQQLTDPSFSDRICRCREKYGVPAERLRIEITERTVAEDPAVVRRVMEKMAGEGILFYLDDFGVGYSNLASMMTLPFETVKLDASLVRGVEEKGKAEGTVRLLMQMLHHAGFQVVAEGVETEEQADRMMELSANRIQGYYYARPMPEEVLVGFFEKLARTSDRKY